MLGVGLTITTITGFLLSVEVGIFGFRDTWLAPFAKEAFLIECTSIVALAAAATLCLLKPARRIESTHITPVFHFVPNRAAA